MKKTDNALYIDSSELSIGFLFRLYLRLAEEQLSKQLGKRLEKPEDFGRCARIVNAQRVIRVLILSYREFATVSEGELEGIRQCFSLCSFSSIGFADDRSKTLVSSLFQLYLKMLEKQLLEQFGEKTIDVREVGLVVNTLGRQKFIQDLLLSRRESIVVSGDDLGALKPFFE